MNRLALLTAEASLANSLSRQLVRTYRPDPDNDPANPPLLKAPLWQQSKMMTVRAADDCLMKSPICRELTDVEISSSVAVSCVQR